MNENCCPLTPTIAISVATVRKTPLRTLRSEEHTSELQSRSDLVCRLLLEKKTGGRRPRRLRVSRVRARVHPPSLLPGAGAFPLVGAVRRSAGHLHHRPGDPGCFYGEGALAPLADDGAEAGEVPGPARAHLLAWVWRAGESRPGLQRPGGEREGEGADRDRARPPGLRQRGQPEPRDRSDERRLRRHRRLADPERAGQRRERRLLGFLPSRRWRGHRIFAARGPGDRRGRDARGGEAARAGAAERSGDGPPPARRPRV